MTSSIATPARPDPSATAMLRVLKRLGLQTAYVLTSFPLALFGFVLVVTTLSLGFGLLITLIGVPVLVGALLAARGLATMERGRLEKLMNVGPYPSPYRQPAPDESGLSRLLLPLRDQQSWLDVVHALVALPIAIMAWTVVLTWWAVAISGTTWLFWGWLPPSDGDNTDLPELIGLGSSYGIRAVFYTAVGLVAAVTLPWAVMAVSKGYAAFSRMLLIEPGRHRHRVESLEVGRDATRAAEESSFRRLERDIHDGPQQRLVRLSMDLGRAEKKAADAGPELAAALGDARRQTQETLEELRALSRGIAPPILADRGLHRALEELAVRSPVPTECVVELNGHRLEPHVESAVYFLASEALTNMSKHSGATQADIQVAAADGLLTVRVTDDGHGGAQVTPGHGLAGLNDRIRAVDGVFSISSPVGGPTTIAAEIPCGS